MPHVPKTQVVPKRPNIVKVLLAILVGSIVAFAVAQAFSSPTTSTLHRDQLSHTAILRA